MKSPTFNSKPWRGSWSETPQRSPIRSGRGTGIDAGAHMASNAPSATPVFLGRAAPQRRTDNTRQYQQRKEEVFRGGGSIQPMSSMMLPPPQQQQQLRRGGTSSPVHPLPLYDQPAFRADLVHRSVFVFGLQTAEECRALLQLLQVQCGPISGAFRTADHSVGGMKGTGRAASEASSSSSAYNGGCVVICVVFHRAESAMLAKRLDNTAEVYQKRFVVEGAAHFRHLSHQPVARSASSAELPQHERLWQLLFSPTVGGATVDWHAAALAAERGEALLLSSPTITARGGGSGSNTPVHRQHSTVDVAPAIDLDVGLPRQRMMMGTTPAAAPPTQVASTTAVDLDALGRSNTLQQQYYSERYGRPGAPVLSSLLGFASSLVQTVLGSKRGDDPQQSTTAPATVTTPNTNASGRNADGLLGVEPRYDDSYPRASVRHRVERAGNWNYTGTSADAGSASIGAINGHTLRGDNNGGARSNKHNNNNSSSSISNNNNDPAVYIPRMRSAGDYVAAALPFASSLLSPLFRGAEGDAAAAAAAGAAAKKALPSHSSGRLAVTNRMDTGSRNSGGGPVEELVYSPFSEGGASPQARHARLWRKRHRNTDQAYFHPRGGGGGGGGRKLGAVSDDDDDIDDDDDDQLHGIGDGFASVAPDVLSASFAPSTAAGRRRFADAGGANSLHLPSHTTPPRTMMNSRSTSRGESRTPAVRPLTSAAAGNDAVREYVERQVRLRALPFRSDNTARAADAPVTEQDAPPPFALSRLLRRACTASKGGDSTQRRR